MVFATVLVGIFTKVVLSNLLIINPEKIMKRLRSCLSELFRIDYVCFFE